MKDKINDSRIKQVMNDYIISLPVLILISIILWTSDFFLSKPLYIMVLDMGGVLGSVLAIGMATLFTVLPKVAAKLFAKTDYGLGLLAIACGIGLLSFIYIGQAEVARQKADDPLIIAISGKTEPPAESYTHLIATSLIALLYGCALFLSYIYYSDVTKFKPMNFILSMSKLSRLFQYNLLPLRNRFERAKDKPTIIAESRVNEHTEALEKETRELQLKLDRQQAELNYDLKQHNIRRDRIKAAIEAAYNI